MYINNCKFGEVEDLFYVTSQYAGEGLTSTNYSDISDIHINGLSCTKASAAALVLQGTRQRPIRNVSLNNISVGEARTGISFSNTSDVRIGECHIGPSAGVPTQVSAKDKIFE